MSNNELPRGIAVCRTLGLLFLSLLFAAPLATRCGLISYQFGLPLVALAVLGSVPVLLTLLVMVLRTRFRAHRAQLGALAVVTALPLGAAVALILPGAGLPLIHDISTDMIDPPVFGNALVLRGPDANPLLRSTDIDTAQSAAYPQLRSIESTLAPAAAFARALDTALALGWDIHTTDAARGVLEASETTFWFGFTDDIVIRVQAINGGSRIDLRSVSRVGRGDLGANARRIGRFVDAFADDRS
jgi:hypothetical protein